MRIPSRLKELLPAESVKQWMELVNQPALVASLKEAAQQLGWKESWGSSQLQHSVLQAKKWLESFQERWMVSERDSLRLGINGTGLLFSKRWTTTPQSSSAISMHAFVSGGYSEPGAIDRDLKDLLLGLSGAEACLVTHSVEQAIVLLCQELDPPRRWAVPKPDSIRLAGGGELVGLLSRSEHRALEFGAANACQEADFEQARAAGANGFFLLRPSHRGTTDRGSAIPSEEQVATWRNQGTALVEWLVDGSLVDLSPLGLPITPVALRCRQGVDAVLLAGDGWLGGPPCGLLFGREAFLRPAIEAAGKLGMGAHPQVQATLHACLSSALDYESWQRSPLGLMASNGVENLVQRAKRMAIQLNGLAHLEEVAAEQSNFPLADPPSECRLDSGTVRLRFKDLSPREAQARLVNRETPLWSLADDRCLRIVLRTVEPSDDQEVIAALEGLGG